MTSKALNSNDAQYRNYIAKTNAVLQGTTLEVKQVLKNINGAPADRDFILNRHVTNKSIWVMDETFLGGFGVFSVHDLKSQCCKGYVITERRRQSLNSDHILALLGMLFMQVAATEGVGYPYCIHGVSRTFVSGQRSIVAYRRGD